MRFKILIRHSDKDDDGDLRAPYSAAGIGVGFRI